MQRYTCPSDLLPMIEAALAAEGYVIEEPLQRAVGGSRIVVMSCDADVISLHEDIAHNTADITVYSSGKARGPTALAQLPRLFP